MTEKKQRNSVGRQKVMSERIRGYSTGEEGGGSGHSKEVLHNGKNNVIADKKIFLLFLVNNNYYFLLANADLQKISAFVFFDKTYIQKPHCVMIENISSNKT